MDPVKMKSITQWLMEKVNEYEEQFGNITPECRQQTAEVGDIKKTFPGVT
jgi:hypothetical protein